MTVATGPGWELRCGRYQEALADVGEVSAVICDPPYGARTHAGQRLDRDPRYSTARNPSALATLTNRGLEYDGWTEADVEALVSLWGDCPGWFCAFTSHDLIHAYMRALENMGRYVFAPLPCVLRGMNVRLAGDGPSSWTVWLVVSRPRSLGRWGTLPGAYIGSPGGGWDRAKLPVPGAKPLWLMRSVVSDYSRPGDLVVDPTAGGATTLLAAVLEGRRSIGAEADADTFALAAERLHAEANFRVMDVDDRGVPRMKQQSLDLGESA